MKKIVSILLGTVMIVLFALTWYCSSKTEQLFSAQISALNQKSAGLYKLELESYRRRLFSATAKTVITLPSSEKIWLKHQFRHFVWGIKMVTRLIPDSAPINQLTDLTPAENLELVTTIDLQGNSNSTMELPQLNISTTTGTLKLSDITARWDFDHEMANGVFDLQINQLRQIDTPESTIILKNLHYRGQTTLTAKTLSVGIDFNIDQLELAGGNFSDARIKLNLRDIDAELFLSLQQIAAQLQRDGLDHTNNSFTLRLRLLELYSQLINSGMTLDLEELSLHSDDGKLSGHGKLSLKNSNNAAILFSPIEAINAKFLFEIDKDLFTNGYRVFNNLRSNSKKENPAILAEQAEQLAGGLVQKGILTRQENNSYRIDFSLSEGQMKLNGDSI